MITCILYLIKYNQHRWYYYKIVNKDIPLQGFQIWLGMAIHNGTRQPPFFSTPELWWNLAIVPLDNGNHNQQHCPAMSMASYAGVLFMHGPGISPYGTVTVEVGYTPIGTAVWHPSVSESPLGQTHIRVFQRHCQPHWRNLFAS